MTFNEKLLEYQSLLDCSQSDVSESSGLSPAVISRYFNNERTPNYNSPQLDALATGLAKIAESKNIPGQTKSDILYEFRQVLTPYNTSALSVKVDNLIYILDIHIVDLAKFIPYDASYISRIRNGKRIPSKPDKFVELFCGYIVKNHTSEKDYDNVASLIGCNVEDIIDNPSEYLNKLLLFFSVSENNAIHTTDNYLHKLDSFDLNDYIKSIHFDTLKVPSMPFQLPISKDYYGIVEMRNGEIDFLKSTVLSTCMEPLYMYSDMPMEDMADDIEFGKKWMLGLAMVLKKGMQINIIHNLDRPFNELMLGLESWIPLYMTGLVNPFYFKNSPNRIYNILNYYSGSTALSGESITDHHEYGKYHLTRNKRELAYYKKRTEDLFSKAVPLMKIYQESNRSEYNIFIKSEKNIGSDHKNIWPVLPIHTMPDNVTDSILEHNDIDSETKDIIKIYITNQKAIFKNHVSKYKITDEIPVLSEDNFKNNSILLLLPDLFLENDIYYSYQEYKEHLNATLDFANDNNNYTIVKDATPEFLNITIHMVLGEYVVVSKSKHPIIHFVIYHPTLRNAIENIKAPVND